jgi:AraC-like DNA-binding protein
MPRLLSGGDLVVLPRGEGHVLSDRAANVPAAIDYAVKAQPGALACFTNNGTEPATRIICGSFQIRRHAGISLLSLLPEVLHVQGRGGKPPEWLAGVSALLVSEAQERRLGRSAVMTRLTDVLVVQVLRHWIDQSTDRGRSLLALRDPRIGSVLTFIHANLERPLSLDELAREAAMSRSAFAERFTELVGEPPARYIARWRMQRASDLLLNTSLPVGEVASSIGYATAAAFDKAFSRHFHTSPGAYRSPRRGPRRRLVTR